MSHYEDELDSSAEGMDDTPYRPVFRKVFRGEAPLLSMGAALTTRREKNKL
ncbi:hypothetical protein BBB_0986 [Bifidobacterium bifidum BGN4]|uniref:Uncharacterized protein n=1 Tax=Bifidobacterium bifidum BGN4 TaxID=484020 RepID=I3WI65_BIFBI|nr:hypothetical protein BBB_0986 [Bifidobacterium bifidum BGN4]ALE11469.1 Hypothetical protein RY70_1116 [Bifidobacterium bifidum]